MDGTRSFSELLAYVLVAAMAAALAFPLVAPVFRRWANVARDSRWRAAVSAALLFVFVYIGGSLDKQQQSAPFTPESFFGGGQPSLRTGEGPSQPQWYADLGYPATDTDGDGIPDYWERRTHTNPAVADADADPDNDGVDNAEEFLHQCDPIVTDTDGDGLTDREEIDGRAAGWAGFDPLDGNPYDDDESDAGAWGNDTEIVVYSGVSSAGYPWGVDIPDEAANNVDVIVTVDTSRHAELSWDDGDDWPSRLLLPPCTNLALRLRIPVDVVSSATLSPAHGATGLWRAALRAEWDRRRGLDIERNRVEAANGAMVDIAKAPAIFEGVLPGTFAATNAEPTRAGGPRRGIIHQNAPPTVTFTPRSVGSIMGPFSCLVHGPDPQFVASFWNADPPYVWTVNDESFVTSVPVLTTADGFSMSDVMDVSCTAKDEFLRLKLTAHGIFQPTPCQGGPVTNIVGAGWTSTHNPTNATDHLPHVEEGVLSQPHGPLCPVYTNTVVHAGWTHNTEILWIRNLVRILTGDPWDDETDHCIALQYDSGGTIDLFDYLSDVCLPYRDDFTFKVNGRPISGHTIPMSTFSTDDDLLPRVFHVSFSHNESPEMDRMWIVLYVDSFKTGYDTWKTSFGSTAWTSCLPAVYSSIGLVTNSNGKVANAFRVSRNSRASGNISC